MKKNRKAGPSHYPKLGYKDGHHKKRAQGLGSGNHFQNIERHADDSCDVIARYGILQQGPLNQADPGADHDPDQESGRDDAKASGLDQDQNDCLAEQAPVGGGIVNDQSCHASRGSSRKQTVQKRSCLSAPAGDGHHEKERPQKDDRQKSGQDDLSGCKPVIFVTHIGMDGCKR